MQVKPEAFDDLRTAVAKVDALAAAAEQHFDETQWGPHVERQRIERQAHLCGAVREAAEHALLAVDALNALALNPEIPDADPSAWSEP